MPWRLHHDVSFCRLDGRLIFLDIQKDRYFQLSEPQEHIFLAHIADSEDSGVHIFALIKRGILTLVPADAEGAPLSIAVTPTRSAVEGRRYAPRLSTTVVRNVLMAVISTQFQLKTRGLKYTLDALAKYRRMKTHPLTPVSPHLEQRLLESSVEFKHARLYVPIETCCLLDSISMVRYLAKRGFSVQLVLGVACDPFSAHAWVQSEDIVMNDTAGSAQAYVPIRVI